MKFKLPASKLRRRTGRFSYDVPYCLGRRTSKFGSSLSVRLSVAGAVAVWLGGVPDALAQVTNLPATMEGLPAAGYSLLRMLGALAFVLALFLAGVWLYKHWQRVAVYKGRPPKLNVLEVKPLGNRTALYVVGYEQQRLLLAASPAGVHFLSHLPTADPADAAPSVATFAETLERTLIAKA